MDIVKSLYTPRKYIAIHIRINLFVKEVRGVNLISGFEAASSLKT
jgi:hypothetical protein